MKAFIRATGLLLWSEPDGYVGVLNSACHIVLVLLSAGV